MMLNTLGVSSLWNLLTGKGLGEQVKAQLEQPRVFHPTSSFN